jgi:hypothetical protein
MYAPQGAVKVLQHAIERQFQRRAPTDKHIIVAGSRSVSGRQPHHFAQAPADPVALDRVAGLLRHGKAETHRPVFRPFARLKKKCRS